MVEKIIKTKKKLNNKSLIHCITNPISINDLANVVLALGCKPIMAEHPKEVSQITKTASVLAVNLGNITDVRMKSMMISGKTAVKNSVPCIIDVVGVACSDLRFKFAKKFIKKCKPKVIKGNLSEIKVLTGLESNSIGVDASEKDMVNNETIKAFSEYSKKHNAVILASGEIDVIVFGDVFYKVKNGVSMLAKVTGTGCMLGAIIATFMSTGDILEAVILGTASLGIAGELADTSKGTGSFRVSLIDNLYKLDEKNILLKINLEECKIEI